MCRPRPAFYVSCPTHGVVAPHMMEKGHAPYVARREGKKMFAYCAPCLAWLSDAMKRLRDPVARKAWWAEGNEARWVAFKNDAANVLPVRVIDVSDAAVRGEGHKCGSACLNGKRTCGCRCGGMCHGAGKCICGTPEAEMWKRAALGLPALKAAAPIPAVAP